MTRWHSHHALILNHLALQERNIANGQWCAKQLWFGPTDSESTEDFFVTCKVYQCRLRWGVLAHKACFGSPRKALLRPPSPPPSAAFQSLCWRLKSPTVPTAFASFSCHLSLPSDFGGSEPRNNWRWHLHNTAVTSTLSQLGWPRGLAAS